MRILIFIEHDIIFRHFYLSKAFKDIETSHDVKYIFPREQSKDQDLILIQQIMVLIKIHTNF